LIFYFLIILKVLAEFPTTDKEFFLGQWLIFDAGAGAYLFSI
jgi:hypothetical protein